MVAAVPDVIRDLFPPSGGGLGSRPGRGFLACNGRAAPGPRGGRAELGYWQCGRNTCDGSSVRTAAKAPSPGGGFEPSRKRSSGPFQARTGEAPSRALPGKPGRAGSIKDSTYFGCLLARSKTSEGFPKNHYNSLPYGEKNATRKSRISDRTTLQRRAIMSRTSQYRLIRSIRFLANKISILGENLRRFLKRAILGQRPKIARCAYTTS